MKEWLTSPEIAAAKLPGLPGTRQKVREYINRAGWSDHATLSRAREQDNRGRPTLEYHYSLLPAVAQAAWLERCRRQAEAVEQATAEAPAPDPAKANLEREIAWARYRTLPEERKAKARDKLAVLDDIERLIASGNSKTLAVQLVSDHRQVSPASVYGWYTKVAGVARADWLPMLADQYVGRTVTAEMSPEAWEYFKADYLTTSQSALTASYDRMVEVGKVRGWVMPNAKTFERRLQREVPPEVVIRLRKGREAADRLFPAQRRDRSMLHALEAVNWDGHKFDVFVWWPGLGKDGTDKEVRPVISVFQDLYSGKILSWRLDVSENTTSFRLAFGDMVEAYGIPEIAVIDNTRTAANKQMTGGTPTRFRFKVKDEDPNGLFTILGVKVHWTQPYHGQAKPIERAFRDLCETIAKAPECVGAYTGNSPVTKPENHGARALTLNDFIALVEREIRRHNAKPGRRSKVCGGVKSFDQAFAESYEQAPIRKARPEHRLLWLLPAEGVTARVPDGHIELMGNRYWCEALIGLIGTKLVVRFDPDNLHQPVHVYRLSGAYVATAECAYDTGFFDLEAAKKHAKAKGAFRKATKAAAEAHVTLTAAEVAAMRPEVPAEVLPEARVIRGMFPTSGNAALAASPKQQTVPEEEFDVAAAFAAGVVKLVVDNGQ